MISSTRFDIHTDSFTAAPQVAGLIATYIADSILPSEWNTVKGIQRVTAIRQYLFSNASSWVRPKGCRMIWNGASQNEHENAQKAVESEANKDTLTKNSSNPFKSAFEDIGSRRYLAQSLKNPECFGL